MSIVAMTRASRRPVPRARWRWIASCVALVVLAASCSGDDGVRRDADPDVPGVLNAGELSVFDLRPGDCLGDLTEVTDQPTMLPVQPCSEPHRIEVYLVADYCLVGGEPVTCATDDDPEDDEVPQPAKDPDTPYPGGGELADFADGVCLGAFGAYTGIDYFSLAEDGGASSLYFSYLYPTLDSWQRSPNPDRGIVCVVGSSADLFASVAGRGDDLPLEPSS